jgi:hypothetical protein
MPTFPWIIIVGNSPFTWGPLEATTTLSGCVPDWNVVLPMRVPSCMTEEMRSSTRVRVGCCKDLESAEQYERYLAENGFPNAFIVAD